MLNKMSNTNLKLGRTHNKGFTLIEVLIALVIISFGLLALATMQLTSIQYSNSAKQRAQATFFAYDILDRMRANIEEAEDGNSVFSYKSNSSSPITAT